MSKYVKVEKLSRSRRFREEHEVDATQVQGGAKSIVSQIYNDLYVVDREGVVLRKHDPSKKEKQEDEDAVVPSFIPLCSVMSDDKILLESDSLADKEALNYPESVSDSQAVSLDQLSQDVSYEKRLTEPRFIKDYSPEESHIDVIPVYLSASTNNRVPSSDVMWNDSRPKPALKEKERFKYIAFTLKDFFLNAERKHLEVLHIVLSLYDVATERKISEDHRMKYNPKKNRRIIFKVSAEEVLPRNIFLVVKVEKTVSSGDYKSGVLQPYALRAKGSKKYKKLKYRERMELFESKHGQFKQLLCWGFSQVFSSDNLAPMFLSPKKSGSLRKNGTASMSRMSITRKMLEEGGWNNIDKFDVRISPMLVFGKSTKLTDAHETVQTIHELYETLSLQQLRKKFGFPGESEMSFSVVVDTSLRKLTKGYKTVNYTGSRLVSKDGDEKIGKAILKKYFPVEEPLNLINDFYNILYIYPREILGGSHGLVSKTSNIAVSVKLLDSYDALDADGLGVWFGEDGVAASKEVYIRSFINAKSLEFSDELKMEIPIDLSSFHHLLFTFYSVELKKVDPSATNYKVVGHAVLPLKKDTGLINGDYNIKLIPDLSNSNYFEDVIRSESEKAKQSLNLSVRPHSVLYPKDSEFMYFLANISKERGHNLAQREVLGKVDKFEKFTLFQYFYTIMDLLLDMMVIAEPMSIGDLEKCAGGEPVGSLSGAKDSTEITDSEISLLAFRKIVKVVSRMLKERPETKDTIIRGFVHYYFNRDPSTCERVAINMITNWIREMDRDSGDLGAEIPGDPFDLEGLDVSNFFFFPLEIISKSMSLASISPPEDSKLFPTSENGNSTDYAANLLQAFSQRVITRIKMMKFSPSKIMNHEYAYFVRELLDIYSFESGSTKVDSDWIIQELIYKHVDGLSTTDASPTGSRLKKSEDVAKGTSSGENADASKGDDKSATDTRSKENPPDLRIRGPDAYSKRIGHFLGVIFDYPRFRQLDSRDSIRDSIAKSGKEEILSVFSKNHKLTYILLRIANDLMGDIVLSKVGNKYKQTHKGFSAFVRRVLFKEYLQRGENENYSKDLGLYLPLFNIIVDNLEKFFVIGDSAKADYMVVLLQILHDIDMDILLLWFSNGSIPNRTGFITLLKSALDTDYNVKDSEDPQENLDKLERGYMHPSSMDTDLRSRRRSLTREASKRRSGTLNTVKGSFGASSMDLSSGTIRQSDIVYGESNAKVREEFMSNEIHYILLKVSHMIFKLLSPQQKVGGRSTLVGIRGAEPSIKQDGVVLDSVFTNIVLYLSGKRTTVEFRLAYLDFLQILLTEFVDEIFLPDGVGNGLERGSVYLRTLFEIIFKNVSLRNKKIKAYANSLLYYILKQGYLSESFSRTQTQSLIAFSSHLGDADKLLSQAEIETTSDSIRALQKILKDDKKMKKYKSFDKDLGRHVKTMAKLLEDSKKLVKYSSEIEMIAELYLSIADGYRNVPELRGAWLKNLVEFNEKHGYEIEKTMSKIHLAALMSEVIPRRSHLPTAETFAKIIPSTAREILRIDVGNIKDEMFTEDKLETMLKEVSEELGQEQLYEFMRQFYNILLDVYESREDFEKMEYSCATLSRYYQGAKENKAGGIPRNYGMFFRVKFSGGPADFHLKDKEYVYRTPGESLFELKDRLIKQQMDVYSLGPEKVKVEQGSDDFEVEEGDDTIYIQISKVEPGPYRGDSLSSFRPGRGTKYYWKKPFTKSGKARGSVTEQFLRVTEVECKDAFPFLVNRSLVVKRTTKEIRPIEVALMQLREKNDDFDAVINSNPINTNNLQILLQGSVLTTVNEGAMEICKSFFLQEAKEISEGTITKESAKRYDALREEFKRFRENVRRGVGVNELFIKSSQRPFQEALKLGSAALYELIDFYTDKEIPYAQKLKKSSENVSRMVSQKLMQ